MKVSIAAMRRAVVAVVAVTSGVALVAPTAAQAQGIGVDQPTAVNVAPSKITPNIQDGTVYAITSVGSTVIAGGNFTKVQNAGSTTTISRPDLLAFDASTGAVSTTFAPTLNGTVEAVLPGPTANTVYVGGAFGTVNGVASKGITLLNTTTGQIVSGFKPPKLNGIVYSIGLAGGRVYLAGTFTTAGGVTHDGIATLNATTGKLDPYMNIQLTGHHNYNGSGANGGVGPRAMAINPQGTRAVVIGNFKSADGLSRDQVVMIDIDGASSAVVDPNWATNEFTAACFNWAFDTYVTDVQYSQDGSYFAITATGGSGTNTDGSRSLCDSASRWESNSTGTNVQPTWVDYTGQDSLWSVAITGSVIYVGGHERWLNNSNGYDSAGAGAVPRPGMAALDPISGVPLKWNPGRNPRGAGAYAMYASSTGLYVGSDTDYIGNRTYKRQKIAYFPLAGGKATASTATQSLPANFYEAGQLPNSTNTNVLYRVDAGGPTVAAIDNGPDWMADQSNSDPGAAYRNPDNNSATYSCCATLSSSVPSTTPAAIFNSERWDGGSKNDGDEMAWSFPVTPGMDVGVRLYFANRYGGTSQIGQRVFDVAVDGNTVLPNYDIVKDVGDQTGVMKEFDVVAPASGQVTINFTHEMENPLINGIELINLDAPAGGTNSAVDSLTYRPMNSTTIGAQSTVSNTGVSWGSTRGAFMVGNQIFYGDTSGKFWQASFNGTTVGTPVQVDPYDDPYWSSISTGSGQTYQSVATPYYGELPNVTGAFYTNGRLYYSLLGQSNLYYRYFSPDSGIVGSQEFTASGTGGANFGNIAGMTLSGNTIYYADRSTGDLHSISFGNGTPDGSTDTIVDKTAQSGDDWRTRGMFLFGKPSFPNQLPTAAGSVTNCNGLTCSFDGTGSSDPDGTVEGYAWDFGDGSTSTQASGTHTFAHSGTFTVSLVVTDDQGGQSTPWTGQVTVTGTAPAVTYVAQAGFNGTSNAPAVVIPSGVGAGDTQLLFVSTATTGVTTSAPTGLTGWTQIAQKTTSSLDTTVWQRTGTANDVGQSVSVPLASSTKVDMEFVDYTGVASGTPTLATAADTNQTNHVTPTVTVPSGGAWVLSYWADRNSSTSVWTTPDGATQRLALVGTGGGHVDGQIADSNGNVSAGTYGGLSASTGVQSGRANMVSIVLVPSQ